MEDNMKKILIANRGEIAIRISRAAADLGISTVAVYSTDDDRSLHIRAADESFALNGTGPRAYLDIEQIVSAAKATGCDAIHPGYGFLSENAAFARHCESEGFTFIGPSPDVLELFGNKGEARRLARNCNVPLLRGTDKATSLEEAKDFFLSLGSDAAVMIKAVMGGGGRGMRAVYDLSSLEEAFTLCQYETQKAFGLGDVYVEELIRKPRHIEIQVVGDGKQVLQLGDRDCTMQLRNQKLVEIAPCPTLSKKLRKEITGAALRLARKTNFDNIGTFEFIIESDSEDEGKFAFMEANPRLQVEHTVTEEVAGIDLVRTQIELAAGKSLTDLGLKEDVVPPHFYAMQLRINTEDVDSNGRIHPMGGTIKVYEVPSGPGIRVDGYGYSGYTINPSFDSLLVKLIVTSRSKHYEDVVKKASRFLNEFRIEGVTTNIPFLSNLLLRPEVVKNNFHTRFIEENADKLLSSSKLHRNYFFDSPTEESDEIASRTVQNVPEGTVSVNAPMLGKIVSINVAEGDPVAEGRIIATIEAMKMECEIKADKSGYVHTLCVELNSVVSEGDPIIFLQEAEISDFDSETEEEIDLDAIRPDLAEVIERHAYCLDENRPEEVAKRHNKGQRTARENIENLCDEGSFIEYGALAIAAQRRRRPLEELIKKTPADGLVAGIGSVNNSLVGDKESRCMIMSYDYTVLAGTQGIMNHKKMDRMLKIADKWRLPIVLFAEGGGGRPGDTDANGVAGLDFTTFNMFAGLSGKSPLVGIVSGYCFAGNAALLGCCDTIIATKNSNIGMGGPAMIEGGGLGSVSPIDIGPIEVQTQNGVVDIAVDDEEEAVAMTKKYLSYFQGPITRWEADDQRLLRQLVPENRLRVYDIRAIIKTLADSDTVLELRSQFAPGIITALIRIEGKPFGVVANNPKHLAGAIEADSADKATRFLQLCNVHGLPVLSLIDTPGFMVGPEIETRAQVRHVSRMFLTGSHLNIPVFTVVLRKAYGLGALAMSTGGFHEPFFTASWPSGEFGGMGLEGAVKHGYKKELEAIKDPTEREAAFKRLVEKAYEWGKAINAASYLEIDMIIDPADTRNFIMRGLRSVPDVYKNKNGRDGGLFIDAW